MPTETCWWFATNFSCPWGSCDCGRKGRDGGQNGLADIIRALGTKEFARLRVGIGPVPDRWDPADFVLGKFTASERKIIDVEIARAADAVKLWATEGVAVAMNKFNGKVVAISSRQLQPERRVAGCG